MTPALPLTLSPVKDSGSVILSTVDTRKRVIPTQEESRRSDRNASWSNEILRLRAQNDTSGLTTAEDDTVTQQVPQASCSISLMTQRAAPSPLPAMRPVAPRALARCAPLFPLAPAWRHTRSASASATRSLARDTPRVSISSVAAPSPSPRTSDSCARLALQHGGEAPTPSHPRRRAVGEEHVGVVFPLALPPEMVVGVGRTRLDEWRHRHGGLAVREHRRPGEQRRTGDDVGAVERQRSGRFRKERVVPDQHADPPGRNVEGRQTEIAGCRPGAVFGRQMELAVRPDDAVRSDQHRAVVEPPGIGIPLDQPGDQIRAPPRRRSRAAARCSDRGCSPPVARPSRDRRQHR